MGEKLRVPCPNTGKILELDLYDGAGRQIVHGATTLTVDCAACGRSHIFTGKDLGFDSAGNRTDEPGS